MQAGTSPLLTISDSPRNLPGLQFWANGSAVSLTGSLVDTWIDQSGNARNAAGVGAARPTWGATSGPNSTPSLTYAGAQRLDTAAYNPSSLQLVNIYVLRPNDVTSARVISQTVPGAGSGGCQDAWLGLSSVYNGGHFDAALASVFSTPGTNATHVILEVRHDKTIATGQVSVLINGVLGVQTPITDQDCVSLFGNFPLTIGERSTGILGWIGTITEMIQCSALLSSSAETWLYRGYLGPKYGITVP